MQGANILVDNTGLVKLADFGASKQIEDLVTIGADFCRKHHIQKLRDMGIRSSNVSTVRALQQK